MTTTETISKVTPTEKIERPGFTWEPGTELTVLAINETHRGPRYDVTDDAGNQAIVTPLRLQYL